jgi:hypothetical protein
MESKQRGLFRLPALHQHGSGPAVGKDFGFFGCTLSSEYGNVIRAWIG